MRACGPPRGAFGSGRWDLVPQTGTAPRCWRPGCTRAQPGCAGPDVSSHGGGRRRSIAVSERAAVGGDGAGSAADLVLYRQPDVRDAGGERGERVAVRDDGRDVHQVGVDQGVPVAARDRHDRHILHQLRRHCSRDTGGPRVWAGVAVRTFVNAVPRLFRAAGHGPARTDRDAAQMDVRRRSRTPAAKTGSWMRTRCGPELAPPPRVRPWASVSSWGGSSSHGAAGRTNRSNVCSTFAGGAVWGVERVTM